MNENEMQVFKHPAFGQVRIAEQDGTPWFVALDVCRALELNNTAMAMERLEPDEKGVSLIDTHGGTQHVTVVNEPGLYTLVLGSRKPEARAFKRWVTHEVIPAIRRHGFYGTEGTVERMLSDPDAAIQMLQAFREERNARQTLLAQAERNAPKVLFADSVAASSQSILIGELAKLLKQNGVDVGQKRLFQWLRRDGYLMKYGESLNMPTQRSMEAGWMEIKERTINTPDGNSIITRTTKITGKGQVYFINHYLNRQWAG